MRYNIVGQNIKTLRIGKNMSQEKLANLCDYTRSWISNIENNIRDISTTDIYIISNALSVQPATLFKNVSQISESKRFDTLIKYDKLIADITVE